MVVIYGKLYAASVPLVWGKIVQKLLHERSHPKTVFSHMANDIFLLTGRPHLF